MKQNLILYAEDDKFMAELNISFLEEIGGYEVMWACDGEKAVEMYKERTPDLILLDIEMPKMDGLEVAEAVRMIDKVTPIIFMSSHTDPKVIQKCFNLGANEYINKIIDTNDMLATINRVLQKTE